MPRVETFAALAARVSGSEPRLGTVRLVAVDGGAGSGKTTFAARLATAVGGVQVVHTDDLLAGWSDIVSFWPRLEAWILEPLRAGLPGRFRRYDWDAGRFADWQEVPVAEVVVIEGVTSARAAVRASLSCAVWIEAPAATRLARGIARDGERLRTRWTTWMADEAAHFAADRTAGHADVVVDGDPVVAHDPLTSYVRLGGAAGERLG